MKKKEIKTITLATLADATAQEVFDHVANHLLTQNEVSGGENYGDFMQSCLYRGTPKEGSKNEKLCCAAGSLISDEEYAAIDLKLKNDPLPGGGKLGNTIEGKIWQTLADLKIIPTDAHMELIMDLQHIHDQESVSDWSKLLIRAAKKHGELDDSVVKDHPNYAN